MELDGTYRGFAPTDESGVGFGELEFIIDGDTVCYRWATGLTIISDIESPVSFRELTQEEVAGRFNDGADIEGILGYQMGEDGPTMLFFTKPSEVPEAASVVVLKFFNDDIDAIFGPVHLWTPEQVEAGHFSNAIRAIEEEQGDPGVVPRLENDGQRLNQPA